MKIPIEHLVIKGTALNTQLKKAKKAFETFFRDPVREWLDGIPTHKQEVLGLAQPLLRINKPKDTIDEDRVIEDVRDLIRAGKITPEELSTLVLDGSLNVGNPDQLAQFAAAKAGKPAAGYTIQVVKKAENSVQWNGVSKDSVGKITDEYKRVNDLEDVIVKAANAPLPNGVVERLKELGSSAK